MYYPVFSRGQDAAGEEVIKPYTPTTLDSDLGHFELVIKVIFHCHVPLSFLMLLCWYVYCGEFTSYLVLRIMKMYPQGRMSHHFREMKVGDYLSVKGPKVCLYSIVT